MFVTLNSPQSDVMQAIAEKQKEIQVKEADISNNSPDWSYSQIVQSIQELRKLRSSLAWLKSLVSDRKILRDLERAEAQDRSYLGRFRKDQIASLK